MTLDDIILPDDLDWVNEFNWSPVIRNQQYGADGALFISDSVKQAGRPISFQGEQNTCWITRSEMQALNALLLQPDKTMTLTLSDGRQFTIMFDHASGAIETEKVLKGSYFDSTEYYQINSINFIEV
ncbi:MAG: hypothetical protein AB7E04_08630 [Desulfobacteraceae bacterium]